MHESAEFKVTKENLNYSAEGLRKTFPKYFPDDYSAQQYARQPDKIANHVYANRMGNGDEASGEGNAFKGRGLIQLTGKNNYKAFSDYIKEDMLINPHLLESPKYACLSAAWFFSTNGLNAIADKGSDIDTITAITKRINGGINGLQDRIENFNKVYALLNVSESPTINTGTQSPDLV
jgi:putative chitinase